MTRAESNICKGIAIIYMFIHHLFFSIERFEWAGVKTLFISEHILTLLALSSKICVAIFVFVSAYGISMSIRKKEDDEILLDTFVRYIKLFLNYIPVYIISLILYLVVNQDISVYFSGGEGIKEAVRNIVFDFMGISAIVGTPSVNPAWWYMSYAFILILFVPIIYKIMKDKLFVLLIPISIMVIHWTGLESKEFWMYLPTALLAVYCQKNDVLFKLDKVKNKLWIMAALVLYAFFFVFRGRIGYYSLSDALLAFLTIFIVRYINGIKLSKLYVIQKLNLIMEKLGKYSMNMYLIHYMIYWVAFRKFTYSFKYPVIIVFVLLLDTFLFSFYWNL